MLSKKEQQLLDALAPRAEAEGVEVVTVEIVGAKKAPTIRVFIDTPDGVSFDELSTAQAWINDIMDELDPFPGAYTLEVSSPGIDRPLRTLDHFARFANETAVVKTTQPCEGRSSWTGTILSAKRRALSFSTWTAPVRADTVRYHQTCPLEGRDRFRLLEHSEERKRKRGKFRTD